MVSLMKKNQLCKEIIEKGEWRILFSMGCSPASQIRWHGHKGLKMKDTGASSEERSWKWKQQVHSLPILGVVCSKNRKEAL